MLSHFGGGPFPQFPIGSLVANFCKLGGLGNKGFLWELKFFLLNSYLLFFQNKS